MLMKRGDRCWGVKLSSNYAPRADPSMKNWVQPFNYLKLSFRFSFLKLLKICSTKLNQLSLLLSFSSFLLNRVRIATSQRSQTIAAQMSLLFALAIVSKRNVLRRLTHQHRQQKTMQMEIYHHQCQIIARIKQQRQPRPTIINWIITLQIIRRIMEVELIAKWTIY